MDLLPILLCFSTGKGFKPGVSGGFLCWQDSGKILAQLWLCLACDTAYRVPWWNLWKLVLWPGHCPAWDSFRSHIQSCPSAQLCECEWFMVPRTRFLPAPPNSLTLSTCSDQRNRSLLVTCSPPGTGAAAHCTAQSCGGPDRGW
jgi:hypothetical protein